mmetsp:Transcript_28030/g.59783  ORF Transcript_28030/g.59783 Transcript_28030/m.59783 type:complete len:152 (-) Transcript_28030:847-1302(-)
MATTAWTTMRPWDTAMIIKCHSWEMLQCNRKIFETVWVLLVRVLVVLRYIVMMVIGESDGESVNEDKGEKGGIESDCDSGTDDDESRNNDDGDGGVVSGAETEDDESEMYEESEDDDSYPNGDGNKGGGVASVESNDESKVQESFSGDSFS